MPDERILVLDDDADMVETSRRILSASGYQVIGTTEPAQALELIGSEIPDLVMTDLRMPAMGGLEFLHSVRALDLDVPVIMLTAFATIESAVEAVKQGAFDYVPKPFSLDQLRVAVERALAHSRLSRENRRMRQQLQDMFGLDRIVGASLALQDALRMVRRAARSDADIVVSGDSGTGKELIANAIHANSKRSSGPIVALDCASLPENLLEAELFGYEKGAFTGALKSKPGLMETAHHGTLFLDEVGELPIALQAKLLRTLQEREVRRVGGLKPVSVDVRLVSATNRNLEEMVQAGQFRQDLYYRLNVVNIHLPPLREREGDVPLLAQSFMNQFAAQGKSSAHRIHPDAMAALENYPWPGNVRELRNAIERACALAEGQQIILADLPDAVRRIRVAGASAAAGGPAARAPEPPPAAAGAATLKEAKGRWLSDFEPSYLEQLLKEHHGNVSQAARAAGVDRKTLYRMMKKYDLH